MLSWVGASVGIEGRGGSVRGGGGGNADVEGGGGNVGGGGGNYGSAAEPAGVHVARLERFGVGTS